jgi:hypothetical protein
MLNKDLNDGRDGCSLDGAWRDSQQLPPLRNLCLPIHRVNRKFDSLVEAVRRSRTIPFV